MHHPKPPQDSAVSKKLNKQLQNLERELELAPQSAPTLRVTHSMRKISTWKLSEGVSAILLPERPAPDVSWAWWRAALQEGITERRKLLKRILRQEQQDTIRDVKAWCRARMDRAGEKEIQRLLGKRIDSQPAEMRSSKFKQKRHPDKICANL